MVPKRYMGSLELAAMTEINSMISRSGVGGKAKGFLAAGKKMFGCVKGCMSKKAGNCENRMTCGLALPSDKILVQVL